MTPGGLLQKGDRIVHTASGAKCTVVKREGNDAAYSVIVRPDEKLEFYRQTAFGYPGCFRILEFGYWLKTGAWRLES